MFANDAVIFIKHEIKYKINKVYSHICENVTSNKNKANMTGYYKYEYIAY